MTSTKVGQLWGSARGKKSFDRAQRFPVVFYIAVLIKRLREAHASHHPRNANLNCAQRSIERARAPIFDAAISSATRAPSAAVVSAITSVSCLSHMRVRREAIKIGEYIEDRQFAVGWGSSPLCEEPVKSLSIAIDSTVLTAYPYAENSKIEVIAGRIEREGRMARRFACAIPRRTLARVLVSAALKQCGWSPSTFVDVVNDGASGMRSLVTQVAPRVASPMLDWFHLAMKLHAIRSSLFSCHYFLPRPEVFSRCEKVWRKIREALWRGRAAMGIELTRMLAASMKEEALKRESFYGPTAATTFGAANRLLVFLQHNATILVDYARARRAGRRISTAPAESVMNHLINRRLSKRQQMRWSINGAHYLLQTRVELLLRLV